MSPVLAAIVIAVVAITIVLAVVMGCFGSKPLSFEGRHVLITGGSTGIGLALAKECVKQGASVTVVARTQSKLDAAVAELKAVAAAANSAGQVGAQSADVTDFEQAQAALAAAAEAQGPIDVLICNAGTSVPGYFHDTGVEVFEAQMKLNFFGVLHCVKAAYSAMVARRSGHICIVSSALGTLGIVGYSAYVPSKYAAKGLADALRNELQGSGVSVSVACPPDTATPGFEHVSLPTLLQRAQAGAGGGALVRRAAVSRHAQWWWEGGALRTATARPPGHSACEELSAT